MGQLPRISERVRKQIEKDIKDENSRNANYPD